MSNETKRPKMGHGPMGRGMGTGEKAKDFKGTLKTLWSYLAHYKIGIIFVLLFAVGSTIFSCRRTENSWKCHNRDLQWIDWKNYRGKWD